MKIKNLRAYSKSKTWHFNYYPKVKINGIGIRTDSGPIHTNVGMFDLTDEDLDTFIKFFQDVKIIRAEILAKNKKGHKK